MTTPTTQREADERTKIGNAMADLLHKLMRGYANRVPGDLINAGAALHRQWYATPTAPQAADTRALCMLAAEAAHRNATGGKAMPADQVRAIVDEVLAPQAASQQAGSIVWTDKEIAAACVKAGLGILECHGLLTTLRASQAATTASATDPAMYQGIEVMASPADDRFAAGRAPVQAAQPALPDWMLRSLVADLLHLLPVTFEFAEADRATGNAVVSKLRAILAAPGAAQTADKGQSHE